MSNWRSLVIALLVAAFFANGGFWGVTFFRRNKEISLLRRVLGISLVSVLAGLAVLTFVLPPNGDSNAPTVSLASGKVYCDLGRGSIEISWSGADDSTPLSAMEYRYRLDAEQWTAWTNTHSVSLRELSSGSHTFCVQAKDNIGNVGEDTCVFSVDCPHTADPDLNPPDLSVVCENVICSSDGGASTVHWAAQDDRTPAAHILYRSRVNDGAWSSWSNSVSLDLAELPSGTYAICVQATDEAGNVAEESHDLLVDCPEHRAKTLGVGTHIAGESIGLCINVGEEVAKNIVNRLSIAYYSRVLATNTCLRTSWMMLALFPNEIASPIAGIGAGYYWLPDIQWVSWTMHVAVGLSILFGRDGRASAMVEYTAGFYKRGEFLASFPLLTVEVGIGFPVKSPRRGGKSHEDD